MPCAITFAEEAPRGRAMFGLKSESDEMLALDFLRFVAAVGVVTLHYGGEYLKQIGLPEPAARLEFLNLAVDVFFVISGFVIAYVYSDRIRNLTDYGQFLWRRITRLVPLHWATLGFFVAAGVALSALGIASSAPETFAWPDLVEAALLLHMLGGVSGPAFNYPAWSISAEMLMYIIFPLFLLMGRRKAVLPCLVVAVLGWLAVRDLGVLLPKSLLAPDTMRAFAGFPLGMIVFAALQGRTVKGNGWIALVGVGLVAVCALGALHVQAIWILPIAYSCAVFAATSDRAAFRPAWLKAVGPLGALTYSIYMLHIPVKAAMSYLATLTGGSFEGSLPWLLATIVALAVASWLSYFFFETPLRKALNRTFSRERPSKSVEAPTYITPREQTY